MTSDDGDAVTWWQCEPRRLARDQAEVGERFPGLQWVGQGAGGWIGRLPRWPFDRPEPAGLRTLVGEEGLEVALVYGHAYPMVAPLIYPQDPEPGIAERTDHKWHVNGDGSLCLLQDDATWNGRGSVTDLLLKAAGWRLEYALMRAGVIEAMTLRGIVDDEQSDHLVAVAAESTGGSPEQQANPDGVP
ncbi:hypothetical protein GCM10022225_80550 [Plantactinospora mayteni]|uniref:UBC core domain-containing protein n=1 Tax=Plantactinospora mayteni TaxID=566021 RepID=A0ABQ4F3J9_9ACTN|nr:hypothetical protein [Plantactinospora mayteni]GIH01463.1 hypothetical protein Pma05_80350 [Plantactinospora mayteni]